MSADRAVRVARIVAVAIAVGFGIALVVANVRSWDLEDMNAYWDAAQRIRAGEPLYPVLPTVDAPDVYRYAPWFAWLWVPITLLPKPLVQIAWSATLVASVLVAVHPLLRIRTAASLAVAALLGGLLFRTASTGNVHALLIALLTWGISRRSGPIWIGVVASLKFVPILYVLPYLARRKWRRAAVAMSLAALLVVPTFAYDLRGYPISPGDSLSIASNIGMVPFIAVAIASITIAALLSTGRYRWLATSAAVVSAIPRLDYYDLTYLLVGQPDPELRESRGTRRTPETEAGFRAWRTSG